MTSNSNHSRFSPSKMERRIACPGSISVDNKDFQTKYSKEGKEAHNEAAHILMGQISRPENSLLKYDIADYLDYILNLSGNRYIETQVSIKSISNEMYGTADCVIDDWPSILHVIDLKYGAGKIVEITDNAQLATYGLGALERFGTDYNEIWLTIIQSRIERGEEPIRTWKTTPKGLYKTWYPKIRKAYEKAIANPTLFRPGYHCMWCSGAFECTAAKKESKAIIKRHQKDEAITDDNKKLAKLLESELMILEYLKKAKIEAFKRIQQGQKIPGFKIVRNFGNTTWCDKAKAEQTFREYDDAWEDKLIAIGQLKKLYPNLVEQLTHLPDKGLILVPENDKRNEYRGAADDFKE